MSALDQIIALCRPGFENDCANELMAHAALQHFTAYVKAKPNTGLIQLISSDPANETHTFMQNIHFADLIFTRQWFISSSVITELSEENRVTSILDIIEHNNLSFHDIELAYTDTNTGKSLSKFCKQFSPHLEKGLKNTDHQKSNSGNKLIILFIDSTHAFIGLCQRDNSANCAMGIPRLRMPSSAPSRSTLKLEEAIINFLSPTQQSELIKPGMHAVDLGAAPGGWTWQLVQRQLFVIAIDNGPMDKALMSTEMVEHLKIDAFTYSQKKAVDWLVCDMVEQPHRVSKLIAKWFTKKWCRHAIFNLKLPMNKRYHSVKQCEKTLISALKVTGLNYDIHIKQLYHDREEITVCITTR